MNYNTDSCFIIGQNHSVCEDYAKTKHNEYNAIAVLSDGCSSEEDTDYGARLLTHYYLNGNTELKPLGARFFAEDLVNRTKIVCNKNCLHATLLAINSNSEETNLIVYGDGAFYIKYKSGKEEVICMEQKNNMPFYLYYLHDARLYDQYLNQNTEDNLILDIMTWDRYSPTEPPITSHLNKMSGCYYHRTLNTKEISFVGATSDGIFSFNNPETKTVEGRCNMVKELFKIPHYKGEFATRALNLFKRNYNKSGYTHFDDLSITGVAIQ